MKMLMVLVALIMGLTSLATAGSDPGYHLIKRLPLGGDGGWDYLSVDSAARRLYVSRGTHVMVIDLSTDLVVGDIPDTPGVHGIALAPELNRGFTSNGKADTATIFDLKTLKVLGKVTTGGNPDAIVYDPTSKRVFTFNGRSHDATFFDAASGKLAGTIALGGKPEYAVADGRGKVYVNIEDTNEAVEIDCVAGSVARRFALKGCQEPTGVALDPLGRLFSGCHNRVMTVLSLYSGNILATLPIGGHVDGSAFDLEKGLAFSSNGDGTLTVVRACDRESYRVLQTVKTQAGARTMAIDPVTHYLYLPAARFSEKSANERPEMIEGSFEILVIGE